MSRPCPRCGRRHSGVCGIPAKGGAEDGSGAATNKPVGRARDGYSSEARSRKTPAKVSRRTLEKLLAEARRQEKEVLDILKATSPETEEYDKLVGQLDRLHGLISQLNAQIAEKGDNA